jgi:hypothetical protein
MKRTTEYVFAIVRVDEFKPDHLLWENRVAVKEVLATEKEARDEVTRLSKINDEKGCVYFWQKTRFVANPTKQSGSKQAVN